MNLKDKDLRYIWHPYTHQKNMPPPLPIVKGKGAKFYDESNAAYMDGISSWWVNIHGHGNKYIAAQLFKQAKKLEHIIFAGFTHKPAIELAEKLIQLLPQNFSKIFYSDNGSTAVEIAIKMVLQYWLNIGQPKRNKILAFTNSYHGDTFGAMSLGSKSVFNNAFNDKLFEVIFINPPDGKNLPSIQSMVDAQPDIGCFIYEPLLQAAGGMHMHSALHLADLLSYLQSKNIICIADEVLTGFYRTGTLFASEKIEPKPDIICLSKGLTGGTMALGVTACSEKIYTTFVSDDITKTFYHGHSFTANPLACTAANASIRLIEKVTCRKRISLIINQTNTFSLWLKANEPLIKKKIKNVRTCGTILAFEVSGSDKDGYTNTVIQDFTSYCLKKGVFLRPLGNTIYTMPPYCISGKELKKIFDVIIAYLKQ